MLTCTPCASSMGALGGLPVTVDEDLLEGSPPFQEGGEDERALQVMGALVDPVYGNKGPYTKHKAT